MADDSVPLPYPNLKVPQWQYQIASIPRLKEQASSSFWKAIEEDGKSRSDIRPELQ
jgi:26S proteasome regulatory subunit N7